MSTILRHFTSYMVKLYDLESEWPIANIFNKDILIFEENSVDSSRKELPLISNYYYELWKYVVLFLDKISNSNFLLIKRIK